MLKDRYLRVRSAFSEIKAEHDMLLRNNPEVYVKTDTFTKLKTTDIYILIGRKGVGKTALINQFVCQEGKNYDYVIQMNADNQQFTTLYRMFYSDFETKLPARDMKDIVDHERIFSTIWIAAIQTYIMIQVLMQGNPKGMHTDERKIIEDYITKTIGKKEDYSKINDLQNLLPIFIEIIASILEDVILKSRTLGLIITKVVSFFSQDIFSRLISRKVEEALRVVLEEEKIKVLITLDKYDDFIDQMTQDDIYFRGKKSQRKEDERLSERLRMLLFQRNMLRGLLLATKKIRRTAGYTGIDMALAIPQDRMQELNLREIALFQTNHIAKIEWNPIELLHFFVKRCAFALDRPLQLNSCSDLFKEYDAILKELQISKKVENRATKASEDFVLYITRHSMWRPRDVQRYIIKFCSAVIAKLEAGQKNIDSSKIIRSIVRDESQEISKGEFINEFKFEYPNLAAVLSRFKNCTNILDTATLRDKILSENTKLSEVEMTKDEIILRLYSIGFLGFKISNHFSKDTSILQDGVYIHYKFYYNNFIDHMAADFEGGTNIALGNQWVVHPLFYDRLNIIPDSKFTIHQMEWAQLEVEYGDTCNLI